MRSSSGKMAVRSNSLIYNIIVLLICFQLPTFIISCVVGYKSRVDSNSMLAANQRTIIEEVTRKEEAYRTSTELLEISKLFEMKKLTFHRRIVAASSPKIAALEAAQRLEATWIILDRQMKKDKKYFLDELSCGISRIKRNNNVELLRMPKSTVQIVEYTEESQSQSINDLQVKLEIPEMIDGIPDDEDLFSLEILPLKARSPQKSPNKESTNDVRKGSPGVSTMAPSSSTSTINENQYLQDTLSTLAQKEPECLQLNKVESLCSQRSAADDDSPLFISCQSEIQCTESNKSPFQETQHKHTHDSKVDLAGGAANGELDSVTDLPACLYCGSEPPNIEVKRARVFTYAELHKATNGFSPGNFLSQGGFGSVYKGKLSDGRWVAVKQYNHASLQGEEEFRSEVHVLGKTRHKNVVLLLGSCSEGSNRLLVYEYICNGSLDIHLSKHTPKVLSWKHRMNIALGVAESLNYLHQNNIIHRDTRPSNILITHKYHPLLGDFGLAREITNESEHSLEKKVVGTIGYLAPEYVEKGKVSTKTDVYSFGVVVLELITGRTTGDNTLHEKGLVEWASPLLRDKMYPQLIDERILDCHDVHQLFWMVRVAELCLRKEPAKRLSMEQVEQSLKCTIDGESVTGIEDFSPSSSSDSSLPSSIESYDEQETEIQEIASIRVSLLNRHNRGVAFSSASSTQSSCRSMSVSTSSSSRSMSVSTSSSSRSMSVSTSSSGDQKMDLKKRGKSRSQIFYDEMLG